MLNSGLIIQDQISNVDSFEMSTKTKEEAKNRLLMG